MSKEELQYFYNGLKLVNKYISAFIENNFSLLIVLRCIKFSDCNIQNEAFTACSILLASEIFGFPMPNIITYFDSSRSRYGEYVFDFSDV